MHFRKDSSDSPEFQLDEIKNNEIRIAECYENAEYIINSIDEEFEKATYLEKKDITFLFFAISLQCVRQYLITNVKERLNDQEAARQVKGDKIEKSNRHHRYYNPSLQEIISNPVPFDAIKQSEKIKASSGGVLKGGGWFGHRSTLGHDPILGWIFGTANIATSTLTRWDFQSFHVGTTDRDTIMCRADTVKVLEYTSKKLLNKEKDGLQIIGASLIKEWQHLKSDVNSTKSLPFPITTVISTDLSGELAKWGVDCQNIINVGKQYGMSLAINQLIAMLYGMLLVLDPKYGNLDDAAKSELIKLHRVKTRKILLYSNLIASSSNVIITAISKDVKLLDVGGIIETLHRLVSDTKFITQVKEDFLKSKWKDFVLTDKTQLQLEASSMGINKYKKGMRDQAAIDAEAHRQTIERIENIQNDLSQRRGCLLSLFPRRQKKENIKSIQIIYEKQDADYALKIKAALINQKFKVFMCSEVAFDITSGTPYDHSIFVSDSKMSNEMIKTGNYSLVLDTYGCRILSSNDLRYIVLKWSSKIPSGQREDFIRYYIQMCKNNNDVVFSEDEIDKQIAKRTERIESKQTEKRDLIDWVWDKSFDKKFIPQMQKNINLMILIQILIK